MKQLQKTMMLGLFALTFSFILADLPVKAASCVEKMCNYSSSNSTFSATNYTLGNAKTPYNMIPLASDFRITKISIANPPTQYYAVGGTVKVYVR